MVKRGLILMSNLLLLLNVWLLCYGFILNGCMNNTNNVDIVAGIAALFIIVKEIEKRKL